MFRNVGEHEPELFRNFVPISETISAIALSPFCADFAPNVYAIADHFFLTPTVSEVAMLITYALHAILKVRVTL